MSRRLSPWIEKFKLAHTGSVMVRTTSKEEPLTFGSCLLPCCYDVTLLNSRGSCAKASLPFTSQIQSLPQGTAFLPSIGQPVTSLRHTPAVSHNQLGSQRKPHCKAVKTKARGYIIPISGSPTDSKQPLTASSLLPSEEIITIATNILDTKGDRANTQLSGRPRD